MAATPIRTCMSCGQRAPQSALLRIQSDPQGRLAVVDKARRGRSGYLHPTRACIDGLPKARGIRRSLRRGIDRCERERLAEAVADLSLEKTE